MLNPELQPISHIRLLNRPISGRFAVITSRIPFRHADASIITHDVFLFLRSTTRVGPCEDGKPKGACNQKDTVAICLDTFYM